MSNEELVRWAAGATYTSTTRVFGTAYTGPAKFRRHVMVTATATVGTGMSASFTAGGAALTLATGTTSATSTLGGTLSVTFPVSLSFVVDPGSSYTITKTGTGTLTLVNWVEVDG